MKARSALILLPFLLSVGCATVDLEKDFEHARQMVQERTGESIEWVGVTTDRSTVQARVEDLLAQPLSADAAVRIAILNQPGLQERLASLGIAAAERVQAGLPPNPFLDLAFKFNEGDGPASIELDLVSEVLDLFLLPARKRIAAVAWERARLELAGEVVDLAYETRRQFFVLQAEQQILDMERSVLLAMEAQYETSGRLRKAGNISQLDLLVDRDLYEQTKLMVSSRERSVASQRERLNQLMGLWGSNTNWTIEEELPGLPPEDDALTELETVAVANSLDLRSSWLALDQIARQRRISNVTALLPELEAGIAAEREVEHRDGRTEKDWWYGPALGVEIPVFDQGQPRRTIARMELRRQMAATENLAIQLRSLARTTALDAMYAHQQASYVRDVVLPLRVLITREAQLHYNAMFLGVFQLLDAKRREIEAATQYVQLLRDYWIARTSVDQLRAGRIPPEREMAGPGAADGNGLLQGEGAEEPH